jgi:Domain of unknown function (DUF4062)/AAA ATPase domain
MTTVHPPLRIFISATNVDLREHRATLIDTILRMDEFPQEMRFFGAQAIGDAMAVSLNEIAKADIVVLTVAWRYGTVQPDGLSITHQEYREAARLNKPILVFLADPATETMSREVDLFPLSRRDPEHKEQLLAFRQEVQRGRVVDATFTTSDDLARKVVAALGKYLLSSLAPSPPPSLPKIGIDKVKAGKIIRARDIVFHNKVLYPFEYFITFENYIIERSKDFVGRQFVFDALDNFIATEESGYFIIEGDPGIGKTALMAQLVKHRSYLYYFNIRLQSITEVKLFLHNICVQLINLLQLRNISIPEKQKESEKVFENGSLLNNCLLEASRKLEADERFVLVIDALDEADKPEQGGNLLCLPENLPKGVFVVATNRHNHFIPLQTSRQKGFILRHDSPENIEDIRNYLYYYIQDEQFQQRLQSLHMKPEDFTGRMLTLSEGNFMYLHYVLPAIKDETFHLDILNELPKGLEAYYHFHWQKMREQDTEKFDRLIKPVVCVLAAIEEDVSIDKIAEITNIEYGHVLYVIRKWREFLHEKKTNGIRYYRIYHSTFQKFLEEEVDSGLRPYRKMITSAFKNKYGRKR